MKERIKEFDIARAFAIICMVAVHTECAVYNWGNDVFGTVFDYLGSPFAAPTFMFILGANIYTSSKNTPKQLFTRGVSIFVISLLFNIICHALPFFILDFVNGQASYACNSLHWIFAVDILTFAGLAFMFFALMKKLKVNNFVLVAVGMVLSIINMFLTKNCGIDFNDNWAMAALSSLFYNSSITGYFSFMSWIIFPIAGYVFVQVLQKQKNKTRFYLVLGIICTAVYLFMVYGTYEWFADSPLVVFYNEYSYYQMYPYDAIGNVVFCMGWISIMFFISKIIPKCFYSTISRWNKNLTTIYIIQWFVINYFLVLASNNTLQLGEWQFILCAIAVLAVSDAAAYLYGKYKSWAKVR